MDELCLKQEIDERRAVNVADFLAGPVVLHRASLYLRDIGPPLRGPRMAQLAHRIYDDYPRNRRMPVAGILSCSLCFQRYCGFQILRCARLVD
jgi:hypothetical protein